MILFHIFDETLKTPPIARRLNAHWTVLPLPISSVSDVQSLSIRHCLLDVDLRNVAKGLEARSVLDRVEADGIHVLACRSETLSASNALSLAGLPRIQSPVDDCELIGALGGLASEPDLPGSTAVATVALELAFKSFVGGKKLAVKHLESAVATIADDIGDIGLDAWLASIRDHHEGTYRHCLMVTGIATAFGQTLKLSRSDLTRLSSAALLHDIGKAGINTAILDKNGPLSDEERAIVMMHPEWGAEYVRSHGVADIETQRCVRHHHELLDGSGYPDHLYGRQISDLTRLITIADTFGALIEPRAYKDGMPSPSAYRLLWEMAEAGKLEKALVGAFRPTADQLRAA